MKEKIKWGIKGCAHHCGYALKGIISTYASIISSNCLEHLRSYYNESEETGQ